jgi:hypothetical protein
MGIFTRKVKGPQVLTLKSGRDAFVDVTCDDFHSTEAGLKELPGRVYKDGDSHERSIPVWLRRNERQRIDVISKATGERLGRVLGSYGQMIHDMLVAGERNVNGAMYCASTVKVEVTWEDDEGDWFPIYDVELRFAQPIKATLEPYVA